MTAPRMVQSEPARSNHPRRSAPYLQSGSRFGAQAETLGSNPSDRQQSVGAEHAKLARMHLDGRNVVITGAWTGIGAAAAQVLAARRARVAIVARSHDKLDEVADRIRSAGGIVAVYPADVSDREQVAALARDV